MSDDLSPEWLEACGFRRDNDESSSWRKELGRLGVFVRLDPTPLFACAYRDWRTHPVPNVEIQATRSSVRSAWHALTGTRLVEPMPADIVESTLILADKYEDEGFGDQAAYIREFSGRIDSQNLKIVNLSIQLSEALRLQNGPDRPEGVIFADGSATAGTLVYECLGCRNRSTTGGLCHRPECQTDAQTFYRRPIGVGSGEGRPIVSQGTIISHVYDQLPPEFQRMFTLENNDAWQGHPDD